MSQKRLGVAVSIFQCALQISSTIVFGHLVMKGVMEKEEKLKEVEEETSERAVKKAVKELEEAVSYVCEDPEPRFLYDSTYLCVFQKAMMVFAETPRVRCIEKRIERKERVFLKSNVNNIFNRLEEMKTSMAQMEKKMKVYNESTKKMLRKMEERIEDKRRAESEGGTKKYSKDLKRGRKGTEDSEEEMVNSARKKKSSTMRKKTKK